MNKPKFGSLLREFDISKGSFSVDIQLIPSRRKFKRFLRRGWHGSDLPMRTSELVPRARIEV
jgi:hypothetical protein